MAVEDGVEGVVEVPVVLVVVLVVVDSVVVEVVELGSGTNFQIVVKCLSYLIV